MERRDLLEANGAIFTVQGKALAASASRNVRVLVVGNPANTNCLIAAHNAGLGPTPLPPNQFAAMTRLDHNRAVAQVAAHAGVLPTAIRNMAIWGNHSITQYPDIFHATVNGQPALELVGGIDWVEKEFIPTVQQRGGAILDARGISSAGSAANAIGATIADLGAGHSRRRLDVDGCDFRRSLRDARWRLLLLPSYHGPLGLPSGRGP